MILKNNSVETFLKSELEAIHLVPLDYSVSSELQDALKLKLSQEKKINASVLVLFQGDQFLNSKVLLTERSPHLPTHSGQVAFPGGIIEKKSNGEWESVEAAAIRESYEEVGVRPDLIKVCGKLPSFPTVTGNFEVIPVLGEMQKTDPCDLIFSQEVSFAEWVSVQSLIQNQSWEERSVHGFKIRAPYFGWGKRKMWGLSAWIFDLILKRYDKLTRI